MDSKIRNQLEKMVYGYKEIKTILDDYFMHHRELINKSHKIIHKQGFDTFYVARLQKNFAHEKDVTKIDTFYTTAEGELICCFTD